ncbi:MAG: arylsulfatase [Candidatus Omnitrophica bacterium]|nr:arylsulfatase [Candidatus Omnitrophota bacterium]
MCLRIVGRFFLLALILLIGGLSPDSASTQDKPNIIWFMADDLGYGDLGCYGQKVIQTPNIDRLAEQGMRFTDCYAGSTVCAPSRCCLMTGLHTGHAYIRGNKRVPLRPEDVTIAEVLKEDGYVTGQFGKWGLGEPDTTGGPLNQGFDRFFGYTDQGHAHNYYPEFLWDDNEKITLEGNLNGKQGQYSHNLIMEKGLQFVRENKDKPFFLYYSVTLPHANNEYGRDTGDGMQVPDYGIYAEKDWPSPQKGHAAMITLLDSDFGRLSKLLEDLEIADNTIIFFTSDNGPHREGGADPDFFDSNGPLRGIKRDLYDGGIRVPMIVRWPGKVKPGSVSNFVWAFWDFAPTAAEIAGTSMPGEIDGQSIVPTLLGKDQREHEYLYWEFHERAFKQGVRFGEWKGVRNDLDKPIEIYHVTEDLGEEKNLAEEKPDLVEKVKGWFESARTESEHWPVKKG